MNSGHGAFDVTVKAEIREMAAVQARNDCDRRRDNVARYRLQRLAGLLTGCRHPRPWPVQASVQPAAFLPGLHHVEPEFARAHDGDRDPERDQEIQDPEHHQRRQQLFPAELRQRHQHRGVEHADAAGRMAGEAEQRRQDEHHRQRNEIDVAAAPASADTSPARRSRDRPRRSGSAAASAAPRATPPSSRSARARGGFRPISSQTK